MKSDLLEQSGKYLDQFFSSKWTYSLGRMKALLFELGNPEKSVPVIHVGGTAGKGSTAYLIASILETAGYRVGLHMSPHLISITERIMIGRKPIAGNEFSNILEQIKPAIEKVTKTYPDGAPTYFEITVAMAFYYFSRQNLDVAVIEVGLGGKLDGTNVVDPLVSVITNVGLDHTEILGDTIEKIVLDKREIIKKRRPVVSGVIQPQIRALISEKSKKVDAPLFLINRDFHVQNLITRPAGKLPTPITFDYISSKRSISSLNLSLMGRYQATNAALAITAVLESGLHITDTTIRNILGSIMYPGRMEIAQLKKSKLLIDGAHNPMKMSALAGALDDHFPARKFPTLLAVKGDKDASKMISSLAPHVLHWYVTSLERQTDWGKRVMLPAGDLEKIVRLVDPEKPITMITNYKKLLENPPKNMLLVTGSLYLIGAVEELIGAGGSKTI